MIAVALVSCSVAYGLYHGHNTVIMPLWMSCQGWRRESVLASFTKNIATTTCEILVRSDLNSLR
jgi:hypothetical protein